MRKYFKYYHTLVFFLFSGFSLVLPQNSSQLKFERISIEQGLSYPQVNAILQDSGGFLWIGTLDGLNRYDGYNFTMYKHNPEDSTSISDHWIEALYQDSAGRLWIGTQNGLNRFDYHKDVFRRFKRDRQNPVNLSSEHVRVIHEDRSGTLWFGTQNGGLIKFDPITKKSKQFKNDPDNPRSLSHNIVIAIHEDSNGKLWIGTLGGGLNLFDSETESFTHFKNGRGLAMDNVLTIYEDRFGMLWIGTYGGGLYRLDWDNRAAEIVPSNGQQPEFSHFLSQNRVSSIAEDRYGTLWIGTFGNGLFKYIREDSHFENFSHDPAYPTTLSNDHIHVMFEDRSGNFWIGTDAGLNKLTIESENFNYYGIATPGPDGSGDVEVWAIAETKKQDIVIGTNNGVYKLDRNKNQISQIRLPFFPAEKLSSVLFQALQEDRFGDLWIGTFGYGVYKLDPKSLGFEKFSKKENGLRNSLPDTF